MISGLVSAVMGGYMLCYLLLYPLVLNKQTWQSKVLTFWLPIVILPLLILMTVGVVRRFMDYGLTPPRLYLLTLLLWFYAVCIIMLAVPRKRFRWIFLSLAALFLLSSGHPMNYYRLCRPVLAAKIDKMMENKVLTEEESEQLDKELKYMKDCYGKDFVSRWGKIDTAVVVEPSITEWQIHYYQSNDYVCPQGYSHIKRINRTFRYSPDTSPDRDLRDGILPVRYENNIILLFDTAAIRQADLHSAPMIIPSADKKSAYVPITITISSRSDKTINFDYSGFLFTK
jgi:hypothetical protein